MIGRFIPFILILSLSCQTASKTAQKRVIVEENKDVIILSNLISDYMQKTSNSNFTLSDIAKFDTLQLVTKNFSNLEVGNWPNAWRGGYAVYFKFSEDRNKDSVRLLQYNRIPWKVKTKKKIGRNDTQLAAKFDGEIHLYYPERFYRVVGILMKETAN
jgi:hypothetical protein